MTFVLGCVRIINVAKYFQVPSVGPNLQGEMNEIFPKDYHKILLPTKFCPTVAGFDLLHFTFDPFYTTNSIIHLSANKLLGLVSTYKFELT